MALTEQQIDEFLAQPHIAVVATASASAIPHAVPVWYLWRDGKVFFHSAETSKKMRNLRENNHITVVVDSKEPPHRAVVIQGTATQLPADPALAREMAIRYLGEKQGESFAAASTGSGTLVTVTPTNVISW